MTMTNHNDTWGDVNAQLDYFTNAGLSIDSIYNSALTTDKLLSISPTKPTSSSKETTTTWYLATNKVEYPRDCEEDLLSNDIDSLPPLHSTPTKTFTEVDNQPQGMNVCIDKVALLDMRRSKLQEEVQDSMKVCIDKVALFSNRRPRSRKPKHQISSLQRRALKQYKKKKTKHTTTTKKSSGKGIKSPTANDILRGRGRATNTHEGNKKLRDEARKLRDDYQDGLEGKSEKKYQYSLDLVERVRSYGGRFLEKRGTTDNLWYEMSEEDTRKKAAQGEKLCLYNLSRQLALILIPLFPSSFIYIDSTP